MGYCRCAWMRVYGVTYDLLADTRPLLRVQADAERSCTGARPVVKVSLPYVRNCRIVFRKWEAVSAFCMVPCFSFGVAKESIVFFSKYNRRAEFVHHDRYEFCSSCGVIIITAMSFQKKPIFSTCELLTMSVLILYIIVAM